jgi:hypothetical protein
MNRSNTVWFSLTFLLLSPAFASTQTVLVKPYVQPGDGSTLGTSDVKVLCWLTDQKPGDFVVEYEPVAGRTRTAKPERITLDFDQGPGPKKAEPKETEPEKADDPPEKTGALPPEREQHYFKYVAKLTELPFNAEVRYRVKIGETTVREATFRTRATADKPVRFALVGDLANGKEPQKAIAYRIAEQKPEFLVALGDIV